MNATPGSLVRYREREWVVLPSLDPDVVRLRPIGGSGRETCGVVRALSDLMAYSLPYERVEPAEFPPLDPSSVQDLAAARLLLESARLLLREGAAPFKALGHLSFRPRLYQFVPLIMALRLETVRLLIADDVGVGKTIEAGLIVREMLDRGRARRVGVLCPPYLCDQWQRELRDKFHINAVVIRSGTLARLEREAPRDVSVFRHYPHFVASIDLVKSGNSRPQLIQHCPDLLLVDEAHGAAQVSSTRGGGTRQQRHALLRELAADARRHLVLLTATPHSGVEASFLSILGLLRPEFAHLNLSRLREEEFETLARHFVQRRRQHVKRFMSEDTPFPRRDDADTERPYTLSPEYRRFYEAVYTFAQGIVRSAETLSGWKRRMRYWSALALLRCVTSSPAAAEVALAKRADGRRDGAAEAPLEDASDEEVDEAFSPAVADSLDAEAISDAPPSDVFEAQDQDPSWQDRERDRLRAFARDARRLKGDADAKLLTAVEVVGELLAEGYRPIVWCRYIATADYVAEHLQARLAKAYPGLRVAVVTGALQDEERRLVVE
ncbi:MAG: DEAD/DEAH box helicase, partial [Chloroflexi bacterium]|nr:DEAD/DEAH box helicase [Chloroflexota bacterium]